MGSGWALHRRVVQGRQDEVLVGLLPDQAHVLAGTRKVRHDRLAADAAHELLIQGGHGKGCPPELDAVGQGADGVDAVAEQVPVEQQAEAVVGVAAAADGVGPVGAVGGFQAVGGV